MSVWLSPISRGIADHVRSTRTDPIYGYDYDVKVDVAGPDGYGPCRQCLMAFVEGERRLLFLYNPFGSATGDYAGPVFIHEEPCTPHAHPGVPVEIRGLPLTLFAYDDGSHFVGEFAPTRDVESALDDLLADERVAFVHIRNSEARCFVARVDAAAKSHSSDSIGLRG
ncbi:MAG TPA: DUF1203 domain-containing protein [Actinobacteria bacterium]|nr:DUF1203 domain-containing protein [Actinomycetota bacterium]